MTARSPQQAPRDPARSAPGNPFAKTSAGDVSRGVGAAAAENDGPRDVASMKAEISDVQSKTTASLDRSIATAQAALGVGNQVTEDLHTQREQMGQIDRDARNMDADLKRTGYNLKYGFTWRGALTSPFRRASKKPNGAPAGGGNKRDISPVYRDDYKVSSGGGGGSSANQASPAHGGSVGAGSKKSAGGSLFAKKKGAAAEASAAAARADAGPRCPEHVPEGFETQLDVLDGLLDGLNVQARAIGDELRQQNEGIESLGDRVEPLREETASQAQQIKRRFRVKG